MAAAAAVFLLLVDKQEAGNRRLGLIAKQGNIRVFRPRAVAIDQEIERVPLVERLEHAEVHTELPAVGEALKELLRVPAVAKRPADEKEVGVSRGIHSPPVHSASEGCGQRDVELMPGIPQPFAYDITRHEVTGGGPVHFETEPSHYQGLHAL